MLRLASLLLICSVASAYMDVDQIKHLSLDGAVIDYFYDADTGLGFALTSRTINAFYWNGKTVQVGATQSAASGQSWASLSVELIPGKQIAVVAAVSKSTSSSVPAQLFTFKFTQPAAYPATGSFQLYNILLSNYCTFTSGEEIKTLRLSPDAKWLYLVTACCNCIAGGLGRQLHLWKWYHEQGSPSYQQSTPYYTLADGFGQCPYDLVFQDAPYAPYPNAFVTDAKTAAVSRFSYDSTTGKLTFKQQLQEYDFGYQANGGSQPAVLECKGGALIDYWHSDSNTVPCVQVYTAADNAITAMEISSYWSSTKPIQFVSQRYPGTVMTGDPTLLQYAKKIIPTQDGAFLFVWRQTPQESIVILKRDIQSGQITSAYTSSVFQFPNNFHASRLDLSVDGSFLIVSSATAATRLIKFDSSRVQLTDKTSGSNSPSNIVALSFKPYPTTSDYIYMVDSYGSLQCWSFNYWNVYWTQRWSTPVSGGNSYVTVQILYSRYDQMLILQGALQGSTTSGRLLVYNIQNDASPLTYVTAITSSSLPSFAVNALDYPTGMIMGDSSDSSIMIISYSHYNGASGDIPWQIPVTFSTRNSYIVGTCRQSSSADPNYYAPAYWTPYQGLRNGMNAQRLSYTKWLISNDAGMYLLDTNQYSYVSSVYAIADGAYGVYGLMDGISMEMAAPLWDAGNPGYASSAGKIFMAGSGVTQLSVNYYTGVLSWEQNYKLTNWWSKPTQISSIAANSGTYLAVANSDKLSVFRKYQYSNSLDWATDFSISSIYTTYAFSMTFLDDTHLMTFGTSGLAVLEITDTEYPDKPSKTGMIVGIVMGSVFGSLFIFMICCYCCRKRRANVSGSPYVPLEGSASMQPVSANYNPAAYTNMNMHQGTVSSGMSPASMGYAAQPLPGNPYQVINPGMAQYGSGHGQVNYVPPAQYGQAQPVPVQYGQYGIVAQAVPMEAPPSYTSVQVPGTDAAPTAPGGPVDARPEGM